jgi:hypothetical protein
LGFHSIDNRATWNMSTGYRWPRRVHLRTASTFEDPTISPWGDLRQERVFELNPGLRSWYRTAASITFKCRMSSRCSVGMYGAILARQHRRWLCCCGDMYHLRSTFDTYGHSQLKTGHPVRSAIHKQLNGRLVLRWVTTWESLLLYVLTFLLSDAMQPTMLRQCRLFTVVDR